MIQVRTCSPAVAQRTIPMARDQASDFMSERDPRKIYLKSFSLSAVRCPSIRSARALSGLRPLK
jgi:hypothetical protein